MKITTTSLAGVRLIHPTIHQDDRGWFQETSRESELRKAGIVERFVQENQSRSARGVLRGLHFQTSTPQAKLVRCARGAVFDVVVDIRPASPTFGRWEGWQIDDVSGLQVYCPIGFAHGFLVLSDFADVVYRVSAYFDPAAEGVVRYDDPEIGIDWPATPELINERDRTAPRLRDLAGALNIKAGP